MYAMNTNEHKVSHEQEEQEIIQRRIKTCHKTRYPEFEKIGVELPLHASQRNLSVCADHRLQVSLRCPKSAVTVVMKGHQSQKESSAVRYRAGIIYVVRKLSS